MDGWRIPQLEKDVLKLLNTNKPWICRIVSAKVELEGRDVIVRPNSRSWRFVNSGFLVFLAWITLVYPLFIWPIKRFILGSKWWMVGCEFAFLKFIPERDLGGIEVQEETYTCWKSTSKGEACLIGTTEAEWLRDWGPTIKALAHGRKIQKQPLVDPLPKTVLPKTMIHVLAHRNRDYIEPVGTRLSSVEG